MVGQAKALLKKIQFLEWLSTRHKELSKLQMGVAIRLVSLYNAKRGYAWPALDDLAADLDVTKRGVIKAVNRLEELNIFGICRGGGSGNANEYTPRFDLMPDGDAYAAIHSKTVNVCSPISTPNHEQKKVNENAERVNAEAVNGEQASSPHPRKTPSEEEYNRPVTTGSLGSDPLSGKRRINQKRNTAIAKLCQAEALLNDTTAGQINVDTLRYWSAELEEIADGCAFDDPHYQLVRRLRDEIDDRLYGPPENELGQTSEVGGEKVFGEVVRRPFPERSTNGRGTEGEWDYEHSAETDDGRCRQKW